MLGWKDVSTFRFPVVTLLEAVQIKWLLEFHDHDVLCVLLRQYPEISWHLKHKAPFLTQDIARIEQRDCPLAYTLDLEIEFIKRLEDWIVYLTDPQTYDDQSHNTWDSNELLSLTDFREKIVIDIGSGTGSQTFRMAPFAKTIFAVEPVANLRYYLKQKAKQQGHDNVYVVDGLMSDLPYPDAFCDVVTSGHVFGDYIVEEYREMARVVKPGGMIILIPGNNDVDNERHRFLMSKGFAFSRFLEPGDGIKRKYWKTV
jgi:SAM-dependent methyltransferase